MPAQAQNASPMADKKHASATLSCPQPETTVTDNKSPNRRSLLKGVAVAAGAVSAPMLATAQTTTTLRLQSTWPAKDIFHEYAQDFANKVNKMAEGKLKIEVLPAGSVVPPFQLLEAVN